MTRHVIFIPRSVAEKTLWPDAALVSIGMDPADIKDENWHSVLRLRFADHDGWEIASTAEGLFTQEHAREIIAFADSVKDQVDVIVVHCRAGISRSAAVARFLAGYLGIKDFPFAYELYNKHVYGVLQSIARGVSRE